MDEESLEKVEASAEESTQSSDQQTKIPHYDDNDARSLDFSNTLSYELYKLKQPHYKCLIYDKGPLFNKVVSSTSEQLIIKPPEESTTVTKSSETMVEVTKKELKNVKALYDSLASEKRKFLEKIYTIKKPKDDPKKWIRKADSDSQTDSCICSCTTESLILEKRKLEYLMGLTTVDEYPTVERKQDLQEIIYEEPIEDLPTGVSIAMREAQKYLRIHRIFEFYQFLITHLLSASPENPIEFLINLLDRCLMYRGGFTHAPLLYDKKHLDCLFNLMDPMRTGFIELEQYKTGMHTLGICSYNEKPPVNGDGMVGKEFFVEEAYDALSNLLNDMIRRRWIRPLPKKEMKTPPPTLVSTSEEGGRALANFSSNTFTK